MRAMSSRILLRWAWPGGPSRRRGGQPIRSARLAIILLTGWTLIDPLLSLLIALLVAHSAWGVLRDAINILLEAVPSDCAASGPLSGGLYVVGIDFGGCVLKRAHCFIGQMLEILSDGTQRVAVG